MNSAIALLAASTLSYTLNPFATFPDDKRVESAEQTLAAPPADQAQVVFLQPSEFMKKNNQPVALYEVVDGVPRLLAVTGSRSKTALLLSPGHHLLMTSFAFTRAHLLDVNVEAGKRYLVLERSIFSQGFQLRPLRPTGGGNFSVNAPDFPKWMEVTRFCERFQVAEAWYEHHKVDIVDKNYEKAWKEWQGKSDAQRGELTLNPEDAVDL